MRPRSTQRSRAPRATWRRLNASGRFYPSCPCGCRFPVILASPRLSSHRADPFLDLLRAASCGLISPRLTAAEVHAAAAGRACFNAGPAGGYGITVKIDHGNGLASRYAHMSEVLAEEGEAVDKGAVLGRLGSHWPAATAPHLHYEVRVDGEPVDPNAFCAPAAISPRRNSEGRAVPLSGARR